MKYLPLIWAGLSRRWSRTLLSFLSIAVGFLLLGTLYGISAGFDAVVDASSNTRVRVQNRASFTEWLPLSQRSQIERIPGVTAVMPYAYFGGYYQDPKNQVGAGAIDVEALYKVLPEIELPREQWQMMRKTRTGVLVGADLARQYRWKVGDHIAVATPIWQQHSDGSRNWAFDIVGIYSFNNSLPSTEMWMNYAYFDEAAGLHDIVSLYNVAVDNAGSADRISGQIDALFRNSTAPTLTQTERAWLRGRLARIGNVHFMVDAVVGAVLFTLLALAANTMMQSVRERVGEFAVLKTLGYSNATVTGLILMEALMLCASACLCGLGCAALAFPVVFRNVGTGAMALPPSVFAEGIAIAACLALVSAAPPLWRALRLNVATALAAN